MNPLPNIILGNGGAAIHAVMALRSTGYSGKIKQIADTVNPAFNPMLAPYYLKGMIPWNNCFPFGKQFYEKYEIDCLFGNPVTSLDAINHRIVLSDGKKLIYDKCLIATGASCTTPPVPGLQDSPRAFTLRTAEETRKIEKVISSAKKVVVMGASFVGAKLAEILTKKGIRVILSDILPQILPRGAHPEAAAYLEQYFTNKNIDCRLGCGLERVEEVKDGLVCHFPGNIKEKVDLIMVCAGIKPNLEFVDASQVKIKQAILVDKRQQTNVEGLYAAGDVCQGYNRLSGRNEWLGTWGNACYQARTAGLNMGGVSDSFPGGVPQHVSPFFDWSFAQIGRVNDEKGKLRIESSGDPFSGEFRLLAYEDETLMGANLINCVQDAGDIKKEIFEGLTTPSRTKKVPGNDSRAQNRHILLS
jgi:NADPH-dependent 2,4-dienoyl-CoA reductase/sulfur reductase-like enzyme